MNTIQGDEGFNIIVQKLKDLFQLKYLLGILVEVDDLIAPSLSQPEKKTNQLLNINNSG